jgi:hypothetical protein
MNYKKTSKTALYEVTCTLNFNLIPNPSARAAPSFQEKGIQSPRQKGRDGVP